MVRSCHVVSSKDFHECISDISILYEKSDEDHIPVSIELNISSLPEVTSEDNNYQAKIHWESIKENDINKYSNLTDKHLSNICIPVEALLCDNLHCNDSDHKTELGNFYYIAFVVA